LDEALLQEDTRMLLPDDVLDSWKKLDSAVARFRRLSQQVTKAAGRWDLRLLRQRLPETIQLAAEVTAAAEAADAALAAWSAGSAPSAIASYAAELKRAAAQLRLPLQGDFPDYEVFPLKVSLDLQGEQAAIGRRRTTTLEPLALMREVQARHQALHRSSFNANRFMKALTSAHDLLHEAGRAKGMDVSLGAIYEVLTMRSGTGDYTKNEFAFDIYRLRRESNMVYDHKQLSFLNGRGGNFAVPNSKGGTDPLGILRLAEVEGDA
jgi:hypothetical protein